MVYVAPCNRIRNPAKCFVWNPESRGLESGIQEDKVVRIRNPKGWNPESKTSVDSVTLDEIRRSCDAIKLRSLVTCCGTCCVVLQISNECEGFILFL